MRRVQPWKTNRARALRANSSSAEDVLWGHLRNRHLGGYKFVRQAPTGRYFVDFLCRERRTIVEFDGGTHGEPNEIAAAAVRSSDLERLGYRVLRVNNNDIYENIDGVLDSWLAFVDGRGG